MSSFEPLGKKCIAAAAAAVLLSSLPASAAFDVVEKTIPQLESAYSSGATTVQDVINQYLVRINTFDDGPNGVNAVGQINPSLGAAITSVQALINGGATLQQYPLLGVPILIKDSYDVQGMITTNGVSILNGVGTPGSTTLIAKTDAPNIAALKAAGAIILGKANMSTMAYSFDGIDNAHGVVRNPYNYNRQPGGSSSGSGASEASNFAMLTMGGETGGSIRVPSTYNCLVGL
ncbi:MAG: amidase, partial [Phycisphaerales bacterium]|nr:amidase [Phycisphaerales bacterium]